MSQSSIQPNTIATTSTAKPNEIRMQIHTGMLESLGINMYTSIGKSLVEFIANGFDAEATEVHVRIPSAEIEKARKIIRAQAKADLDSGKRDDLTSIYDALPENIEITIADNGHGMTVEDIENKFLIVNRNRRKSTPKSENGLRTVMGRKGLGKLAGFGVAEQVVIQTKRQNETYSTTFTMDYNEIKKYESIQKVKFKPTYQEGLPRDTHGTTITLKKLRCDSLKYKDSSIESVLANNFFITGNDFKVYMNDSLIKEPNVDYEFIYPKETSRNADGFAEVNVKVYEGFEYPILLQVKFRARGQSEDGVERGHLPAYLRGARVYCNQRLAAGPSLFNLETGMHNFHAQSYMECIVHADVLDQQETDLIGTNRSAFKTDNEIVDAFVDTVTEQMRLAIYEHSKFRDQVVQQELEADPTAKTIMNTVSQLPKKTREPATKLLKTLVNTTDGVNSPVFKEMAPYFIKAINSSEILIELIKSGANPTDLKTIIDQLHSLASIEKSDTLKLYRARRNGITGLQKLHEESFKGGRTDKYENELHALLKENPWLIRAEYNQYLTSDNSMGEVARKLNAALKIDDKTDLAATNHGDKRPDLVFILLDPNIATEVAVIELKSPNVHLTNEHLTQLKTYMMNIKETLKKDYQKTVKVTGHLIGNAPKADTQSDSAKLLFDEINQAGPSTMWEVVTIPELLNRARKVHQISIESLEAEEEELAEDE